LHELIWLLLLLEHQELLLLLFIEDVHTTFFTGCCWDTAREVGQLVQLVKVLSSLKQDFLVFRQMLVRVVVCVPQDCHVLLQISYLVVQIDKFLCLLFHEQRPVGNVEFHYGFLLIVNILKVFHLVSCSLQSIGSLFLQLKSIIGKSW
tara:strand:+ start:1124 stop:1567 length:444 start_codon:yes stop_codon:yes gene_type:complete